MKNLIYKSLSIILSITFLLGMPLHVQAKSKEDMREKILYTSSMLKAKLVDDYERMEKQLLDEFRNSNVDYMLSEEYLHAHNQNPVLNADLIELMACYIVIKNELPEVSISQVEFLAVNKSEDVIEYELPVKRYRYIDTGNGRYQRGEVYYITESSEADTYSFTGEYYIKSGKEKIKLQKKMLTYCMVQIRLKTAPELLAEFNLKEDAAAEVERRRQILEKEISGQGITESFFIRLPEQVRNIDFENMEIDKNRQQLILTAASLIGQVPYEWGGKPEKKGYDASWWTIKNNGVQHGLDCSGFVQWAYETAGYPPEIYNNLLSTQMILQTSERVSKEELVPGDLGLLHEGGGTNHVGIYIGNGQYIHCSASAGTVVAEKYDNFSVFVRVPQIDDITLEESEDTMQGFLLSREEKELLYKTVSHEAKGEGINGWIAVTEVILNRINSELYPDTVYEVVYQEGQFEKNFDIQKEKPDALLMQTVDMVVDGKLKILNDESILYFRTAENYGTSNWGKYTYVMTINHHSFYAQNQ